MIHIGFDFNAANCNAVCAVWNGRLLQVFREFTGYFDTPEICKGINEAFPDTRVFAYPDATGIKRTSTNAAISDIAILRKNKYVIRAKTTNPRVRDRVAAVNKAFEASRLYIDTDRCPELTESLEQQVFRTNGEPDKTSNYDHLVDALGYMTYYLMPVQHNRIFKHNYAH